MIFQRDYRDWNPYDCLPLVEAINPDEEILFPHRRFLVALSADVSRALPELALDSFLSEEETLSRLLVRSVSAGSGPAWLDAKAS